MSERTPQAGDWYEKDNCRVRIVGFRRNGVPIAETKSGSLFCADFSGWKHLPGCDSFDWKQPVSIEVDPGEGWRWLEDDEIIAQGDEFFREECSKFKPVDGSIGLKAAVLSGFPVRRRIEIPVPQLTPHNGEPLTAQDVAEIEREESPDDWVTQDRVPARLSDQAWYEYDHYHRRVAKRFWNIRDQTENVGRRHGERVDLGGDIATLHVRCRRKDLPPLPTVQPTANHTCCTIDASGQHELKERKKTITFHEVVVRTPSGRELQWVENRNGMPCTGRTRTEVVE